MKNYWKCKQCGLDFKWYALNNKSVCRSCYLADSEEKTLIQEKVLKQEKRKKKYEFQITLFEADDAEASVIQYYKSLASALKYVSAMKKKGWNISKVLIERIEV